MQDWARFATPWPFFFFFDICERNAVISLTHIVVADLLAGQKMEQGCCTADTESNLSHVSCSHLSSLVLKPHLHHPNAESRLGGQRLPHLKPRRQKDFQHPSPQENKALSGTLEYFGSLTYLPHFPIGTLPLWFALIWVNVEWMPWSFFFGPRGYCLFKALARVQRLFLGSGLQRQLSSSSVWHLVQADRVTPACLG